MGKKSLFREKSLGEINSPEKIDEYISVTVPSVYTILCTLAVMTAALIAWVFFGNVTDKVYIGGVVFPDEDVVGVSIPNSGIVRNVFVHKGDYVEKNQSLALVSVQESYSIVSAPYNGVVLFNKAENTPFEAFEPIVNLINKDTTSVIRNIVAFANFNNLRELHTGMEVQVSPTDLPREKNGYIYGTIVRISKYPISKSEAVQKMKVEDFANNIFPNEGSAFEVTVSLKLDPQNKNEFLWSFPQTEKVDMGVGTFCNIQIITKKRSIYQFLFEMIKDTSRKVELCLD